MTTDNSYYNKNKQTILKERKRWYKENINGTRDRINEYTKNYDYKRFKEKKLNGVIMIDNKTVILTFD